MPTADSRVLILLESHDSIMRFFAAQSAAEDVQAQQRQKYHEKGRQIPPEIRDDACVPQASQH